MAINLTIHDSNGTHSFDIIHNDEFLQSNDIISQRSCPSTPLQNGIAEQKIIICLILVSCAITFLCEVFFTVIHLINRLSSPPLGNESLFAQLFSHPPDYSTLCIIGHVCYVYLLPQERTKLNAQSIQCVFLGYSSQKKDFLCYVKFESLEIFSSKNFFLQHTMTLSILQFLSCLCFLTLQQGPLKIIPWLLFQYKNLHQLLYVVVHAFVSPHKATLSYIPIHSSYKQAMKNECWQKLLKLNFSH
ncbi:hypothetical protein CR513_37885, partial [Mucuna pruriens]